MTKIYRMILTVVMILFVMMGGHAMFSLGFGWPGFILTILLAVGILWEIWVQPFRDEAYRQEILGDIENFKEMLDRAKAPTNLQDATDTIEDLEMQLSVVSGAYIELREDQEDDEEPVQV